MFGLMLFGESRNPVWEKIRDIEIKLRKLGCPESTKSGIPSQEVLRESVKSGNSELPTDHSVDSVEKVPPLGGSELEEDAATVEN